VTGNRRLLDSGRSRSEEHSIDLNALVAPYVGAVIVGLAVAVLVLLFLAIIQARRIGRLGRRIEGLTRGESGGNLERILGVHLDRVNRVAKELDELSARSAVLEGAGRRMFQRVALVRYNPFEETGGNQSFALALLDAHGDGFVITSLHARAGTRVYAKNVSAGKSESALSEEESEAVRQALASDAERSRRGS
jgi:hypothetical protein